MPVGVLIGDTVGHSLHQDDAHATRGTFVRRYRQIGIRALCGVERSAVIVDGKRQLTVGNSTTEVDR